MAWLGPLQLGVAWLGPLQLGVACHRGLPAVNKWGWPAIGHLLHADKLPRHGAHSLRRDARKSGDQLRRLPTLHRHPRVNAGVSIAHHLVLGLGLGQLLHECKLAFVCDLHGAIRLGLVSTALVVGAGALGGR